MFFERIKYPSNCQNHKIGVSQHKIQDELALKK